VGPGPARAGERSSSAAAYSRFFIKGLDGVVRHVEVAAIPITGLQDEFLGAAAMFWEVPK
jgi:hypothetical protein